MEKDHFDDESWREPVPIAIHVKPSDIEMRGKDSLSAFLSEHLLHDLECVERVAIWRAEFASVEPRSDNVCGAEVRAIHARSR